MRSKYKKYPKFIEAMENRHLVYNETLEYIAKKENNGELLVICPESKLPVGRVEKDPEKLKETYEIGRSVAMKRLSDIMSFLM